ncbi:MAG TPA: TIM-barrel domain-containing protein, partial [Armatimonadota bacterium]|nr:TIM-barrel domain-containing protein [Armatimonadota bacterium]
MADTINSDFFLPLRDAGEAVRIERGVDLAVDAERVRIEFIRPDVARVKISYGGDFDLQPTRAVVSDDFGPVPFTLERDGEGLVLASGALKVVLKFRPFSFDVFRADGSPVLRSVPGKAYSHLNGHWRVVRKKGVGDGVFGLGQKTGKLNRNGRSFVMWNTDIMANASEDDALDPEFDPYYMSIPFFYHLISGGAASGSFIDNGYRLRFDFTAPDSYTVEADGGQFTEYIFAGPAMPDILARYTELTGRMELPPIWALGHHQCRWHDYRAEDVRRLARPSREKGIPCDVLWLDIDYMDDFRIFTWDRGKFPDPAALSAGLEKQGFRLITIIDPGVKHDPGYPV